MISINILKNIKIKIYLNSILITGPLGTKNQKKSKNLKIFIKNNKLYLFEKSNKNFFYLNKLLKIMLGLSKGFYKVLTLQGIGYKANVDADKNIVNLKLGFSHEIKFKIPENIQIFQLPPNSLIIYGNNLQKVNQISAKIRKLRPPEPYKGKGIIYKNEIVKIKAGKTT